MDKKAAVGRREEFPRQAVTSTWVLLSSEAQSREAFIVYNEGPATVLLGQTGTPTTSWLALEDGCGFTDNYTKEAWYAYAESGSGTVSGFSVR